MSNVRPRAAARPRKRARRRQSPGLRELAYRAEFRTVVWPNASSRPEVNCAGLGLGHSPQNSRASLSSTFGALRPRLLSLGVDSPAKDITRRWLCIAARSCVQTRGLSGVALFGSLLERDGVFKLFSYYGLSVVRLTIDLAGLANACNGVGRTVNLRRIC